MGELRTNKQGRDLIRQFEDVGLSSQRSAAGGWVIGYGHKERVSDGLTISMAQADSLFRLDLERIEQGVRRAVRTPVGRNEFSALVSLAFDVGIAAFESSAVLVHLNTGDREQAMEALLRMTPGNPAQEHAAGTPAARRRVAEAALFRQRPGDPPTVAPRQPRPIIEGQRPGSSAQPGPPPAPVEVPPAPLPRPGPGPGPVGPAPTIAAPPRPRPAAPLADVGRATRARPGLPRWMHAAMGLALSLCLLAMAREVAEVIDLANLSGGLINGLTDTFVLLPRSVYLLFSLMTVLCVAGVWLMLVLNPTRDRRSR